MTIQEMITLCDDTRPNVFTEKQKVLWLNEVEHKAVDEVFNRAADSFVEWTPYEWDTDAETELLIPDQYNDVYLTYLYSKMDFTLAEIQRYNGDVALFQGAWQEFAGWYRRNHMPLPIYRPLPPKPPVPPEEEESTDGD